MDKIYSFLKAYYRKTTNIKEMHSQERGVADAEIRRIMLTNKRATFNLEEVKSAKADL
jgi:hypothetical protein